MQRTTYPEVQGISLYPLTATRQGTLTSSVPTLLAVSHSIEQTVMHHHLGGVFFAGFQRMSAFLPQANRFKLLASRCQKVYVFGIADAPVPDIPNLEYVYLNEKSPLTSEWFIVFSHEKFSAALLTRQIGEMNSATVRQSEFGRGRLYQGMTTFEPYIVQPAARLLSKSVGLAEPVFFSQGIQPPSSTYIQEFSGYMERANARVINLYQTLDERTRSLERMENIVRTMVSRQAWENATDMLDAGAVVSNQSKRENLSILFTDIEGFTPLFNHVNTDLLTNLLNRYFNILATTIYQNHGDVDKFLGDGMLAFFRDPHQAVQAARQIQARLAVFNNQQAAHLGIRLNTRIGVATGECVITRIGSTDRREVTIIGDAVNIASRLQSNAPSSSIAIDEITYQEVGMPLAFIGRNVTLKGKGLARIYVLQPDESPAPEVQPVSGAGND